MATTKRTAKQTTRKATKKTAKSVAKTATKARRTPAARKVARTTKSATRRTTAAAKKTVGGARASSRSTVAKKAPAHRRAGSAPVDAIALLKQDHREVEQLFKRFEKLGSNEHAAKRKLVAAMIEGLSVHAEIEELVFYPAVRADARKSKSDVLEALEEHHVVKVVLSELEDLAPSAERFDAKVTVMMELVRHHVKEEEGELFPEVREQISRRELLELGDRLRDAKRVVPTRPHPWAPDGPPANAVVGGAVAVMDRARGVGRRAIDRVREELPGL